MKGNIQHIAVVSINRDKYSETFIHHSFDFFTCKKTVLYGGYLPTHFTHDWRTEGEAIPMAKPSFWNKKPENESAQNEYNLRTWLQKARPDIVLAHYGPSGVALAPICKELKIPLVVHFHGYDAYRSDILGSYGLQYPMMFEIAQTIIVVSSDMRRQLRDLGAPAAKVHPCIYGADLSIFKPQAIPDLPFRFAYVGRFVPKKAPDLLIRAFSQVVSQIPDAQLQMVGDGEMLDTCRALVKELNLENAVSFLGVLPSREVARVLGECHALVLPSCRTENGDSEGTPLVILEAGATMRPVIGTDHAGIADVICDGENGLLIPQNDEKALVDAMIRLAQGPDLTLRLGKMAQSIVEERYSLAAYHQNLWNCLENAVDKARNS